GEVVVTQAFLETLPFVSPATWREIQADGITPVVATLTFDWAKSTRGYRVELQPKQATIRVAAIDLLATEVSGNVAIVDGQVELQKLQGKACDGKLAVDGIIAFRQPGVRIDLTKLFLDNADVRQF